MKNVPLVFLGVVFTSGMVLILPVAGRTVSPWILGFLGALTFGIDLLQSASKKTLKEILRLESIAGFELENVARKVNGWNRIFDDHFLLSIVIKATIAASAACIAVSENNLVVFWAYTLGAATFFGAGALMLQNYFYSQNIEKFYDRKTVESRQLAAGKKAADELLHGSDGDKPFASARREASPKKVVLKAG